jgi:tRNA threonylcarbamoyladenosine biosynthesis protein TsaB
MNILALDTSGATATAAVARDGYLVGEISIRNDKTHSQKVIPMVEALLTMLNMKPSDVDMAAVANGPGSFTGVRIGVVAMKAFAYGLKIPVVEVSTLMALAYTLCEQQGLVCPVMDARNRQVFTGLYRINDENTTVVHEDCGISIEELVMLLKKHDTAVHFVGDAVPLYKDYIKEQGINAYFAPDELFTHRAAAVARIAWLNKCEGVVSDAFSVLPNYLRKSQAERMKDKK